MPNIRIPEKSEISFCILLKNKWHHAKVLLKRFQQHHRISPIDSKVRTTLLSIIDSGSEMVKIKLSTFLAVQPPPMITKFSSKDLLSPDEVKFKEPDAFSLPCEATGSNLTWTWKHNGTKITLFYSNPYSLSKDGTLKGSFLKAEHSGTYQCFVKDTRTGVEVFSRKLQVAVTGISYKNKETERQTV